VKRLIQLVGAGAGDEIGRSVVIVTGVVDGAALRPSSKFCKGANDGMKPIRFNDPGVFGFVETLDISGLANG
jgi:hypothetical protein